MLIIFFIVSSKIIKDEAAIELDLPAARTGQQAQTEKMKLILNIISKDEILLGTHPVKLDELTNTLKRESRWHNVPVEICIRTNRQVPYSVIEPVLVRCARSGFTNVTFAVVER